MAALQPAAERRPSSSVDFQKKSFSDLFSGNSMQPALKIRATPSTHKSESTVLFSQEDLDTLATPYRFALVGKFSKGRPKLEEVRKFIRTLDSREAATVGLVDARHVFIRMGNKADYHHVWARGIWYILGFPMRIFKWSPAFHVDREPSVVPIWFQLHKLPLHYFHKEAIF